MKAFRQRQRLGKMSSFFLKKGFKPTVRAGHMHVLCKNLLFVLDNFSRGKCPRGRIIIFFILFQSVSKCFRPEPLLNKPPAHQPAGQGASPSGLFGSASAPRPCPRLGGLRGSALGRAQPKAVVAALRGAKRNLSSSQGGGYCDCGIMRDTCHSMTRVTLHMTHVMRDMTCASCHT